MENPRKQKSANSWVDETGVNPLSLTSHGRTTKVLVLILSLVALSIWSLSSQLPPLQLQDNSLTTPSRLTPSDSCPQDTAITPQKHALIWESLLKEAGTEEYKGKAVEWLSGAIRIACVNSW